MSWAWVKTAVKNLQPGDTYTDGSTAYTVIDVNATSGGVLANIQWCCDGALGTRAWDDGERVIRVMRSAKGEL